MKNIPLIALRRHLQRLISGMRFPLKAVQCKSAFPA
jgi:hypothetical protein